MKRAGSKSRMKKGGKGGKSKDGLGSGDIASLDKKLEM